jgi:hypothetical protein
MNLLHYNKRTSRIRRPSELKTYFDLELLITFEELNLSGTPIVFVDQIEVGQRFSNEHPRQLFTEGSIFPIASLGSNQRLVYHHHEPDSTPRNPKFRPELCVADGTDYRDPYIYTFYDPDLELNQLFTPENVFMARKVNAGYTYASRTTTAIRKLLRAWQVFHYVRTENGDDVHMEDSVPELGDLVPELSFEAYSLRCFRQMYPHYNPEVPFGGLGEEEIKRLNAYRQTVNDFYEDNVIRPFSMLPDPFATTISEFLHNECEDCRMLIHVTNMGVSIRRGLDNKLLPYFDQKFKLQPEEDEENEQAT